MQFVQLVFSPFASHRVENGSDAVVTQMHRLTTAMAAERERMAVKTERMVVGRERLAAAIERMAAERERLAAERERLAAERREGREQLGDIVFQHSLGLGPLSGRLRRGQRQC